MSYLGITRLTALTLRTLTDEELNSLQSTLLRVATAWPGEDLASLSTRTGSSFELADLAATNGIFVNHRFTGGELVKIARTEPYIPAPATP